MRLLLDTHVLLWLTAFPDRVTDRVSKAVADSEQCCVGFASAWEYCAKRARFPDRLPLPFASLIAADFVRLDVSFDLHRFAESLPRIHHDPFDRMLIAQAIDGDLTLVTADAMVRRYPVATLW